MSAAPHPDAALFDLNDEATAMRDLAESLGNLQSVGASPIRAKAVAAARIAADAALVDLRREIAATPARTMDGLWVKAWMVRPAENNNAGTHAVLASIAADLLAIGRRGPQPGARQPD